MRLVGFSTGAVALGDFRLGLSLLRDTSARAVELSALREQELPGLMAALDSLDLSPFEYVSVHAPSRIRDMAEADVAEALLPCLDRKWHVVLHPDAMRDAGCWRQFGKLLCIENMDKRKPTGRTPAELQPFLDDLPDATICLDLAHARQVDSTFAVARLILATFGPERVAQVHLSELDLRSHHARLSQSMVSAVQEMAHWVPDVPIILESQVPPDGIEPELQAAARAFDGGADGSPAQAHAFLAAPVPPRAI